MILDSLLEINTQSKRYVSVVMLVHVRQTFYVSVIYFLSGYNVLFVDVS